MTSQARIPAAWRQLPGAQLAMTVDLQLGVMVAAELVPGGFCPEVVSRADLTGDPCNPGIADLPGHH